MKDGSFLYGKFENICVIKPIGNVSYKTCPYFDRFLTKLFEEKDIADFILDLTETEYMDSTNLGLLARIHKQSTTTLHKRPTIISTNPVITELLAGLGFDRIFKVLGENSDTDPKLKSMPEEGSTSQNDIGSVMLSAHRNLMEINERNAAKFRNVCDLLEKEIHLEEDEM